jgi:two-component system, OmpR family, response regulator
VAEVILLVEDEPAIRQLLAAELASEGYGVIEARHGKEATAAFAEYGHAIDLVVTDVRMPYQSGIELIATLRASRPVKVLYITAYSDEPIKHEAHLIKPFYRDTFIEAVRQVLAGRPQP